MRENDVERSLQLIVEQAVGLKKKKVLAVQA